MESKFRYRKISSAMAAICLLLSFIRATGQTGPELPKELISVEEGTWRSATVFTHVIWKDLLFYGGGSGSDGGDPRHEMEIGIFHLEGPDSGTQHPDNPIITRKQFGLDRPGRGLTPLAIHERQDSLFLFCTARNGKGLHPNIILIGASVDNPYSWDGLRTVIDQKVSGEENNHGASVIVDPDHPENLLIYFAARTPPHEYRILLATVPIAEIASPKSYRMLNDYASAVLKRENGKTNYPHIRYDASNKSYELWYSGHSPDNAGTRSSFRTTSKRKDRFEPASHSVIEPSGKADRNDNVYATGPKVYGNALYYSGRNEKKGNYLSIFYKELSDKNTF